MSADDWMIVDASKYQQWTINNAPQRWFDFKPLPDITAKELADCLPVLLLVTTGQQWWVAMDSLVPEARRHFCETNHDAQDAGEGSTATQTDRGEG